MPTIIFLSETRCNEIDIEGVRKQIGFSHKLVVECKVKETSKGKGIRRAGALCLLWNEDFVIELQSMSDSHIDVVVTRATQELQWRFTGIYGQPKVEDRYKTWSLLRTLGLQGNLPWVVRGDFNEITSREDKEGGVLRNVRQMRGFCDALEFCELQDVAFSGPRFTWSGVRSRHVIKIQLDRFVATDEWFNLFSQSKVRHLNPSNPDHIPIVLEIRGNNKRGQRFKKRFRCEENWGTEAECMGLVTSAWSEFDMNNPIASFKKCLNRTRVSLLGWSSRKFGDLHVELETTRSALSQFFSTESHVDVNEKMRLGSRMNMLLHQETNYWKQRAKTFWMKEGDLNSKYFHRMATKRKRANNIEGLYDGNGNWCDDDDRLGEVVISYFKEIFSSTTDQDGGLAAGLMPRCISEEHNRALEAQITREEVFLALKQMHPTKSLGPDGFSPGFFQKHWSIVGDSIVEVVRGFLVVDDLMNSVGRCSWFLFPKSQPRNRCNNYAQSPFVM